MSDEVLSFELRNSSIVASGAFLRKQNSRIHAFTNLKNSKLKAFFEFPSLLAPLKMEYRRYPALQ